MSPRNGKLTKPPGQRRDKSPQTPARNAIPASHPAAALQRAGGNGAVNTLLTGSSGMLSDDDIAARLEALKDPEQKKAEAEEKLANDKRQLQQAQNDQTRHERLSKFAAVMKQKNYLPEDVRDMMDKHLDMRDMQVLKGYGFAYPTNLFTRYKVRRRIIDAIESYDQDWQDKHKNDSDAQAENERIDEFQSIVDADTARARAAYRPEVIEAIAGGIFGAIGYGIGGDNGALIGSTVDNILQGSGPMAEAGHEAAPAETPRQVDPIIDVRDAEHLQPAPTPDLPKQTPHLSDPADPVSSAAPARGRPGRAAEPDSASFGDASFDAIIREVRNSRLGQRLEAAKRRPDPVLPVDMVRTRAQVDARAHTQARANPPPGQAPGTQIQHQTKTLDVTRDLPPGMDPLAAEVINENILNLQSRTNLPSTVLHVDPHGGGTSFYIGNEPANRPVDISKPGGQLELFEPQTHEPDYQTEHKFTDNYLIPTAAQQIAEARARQSLPASDPRVLAVSAGEQTRWMLTGEPGSERTGRLVNLAANASSRPAAAPLPKPAVTKQLIFDLFKKFMP